MPCGEKKKLSKESIAYETDMKGENIKSLENVKNRTRETFSVGNIIIYSPFAMKGELSIAHEHNFHLALYALNVKRILTNVQFIAMLKSENMCKEQYNKERRRVRLLLGVINEIIAARLRWRNF